jgi:putative ABC transport system substrate-binding protein
LKALTFLGIFFLTHLVPPVTSLAQEPARVARIGLLWPAAAANDPLVAAFKQGLHELGYVEGQNISIEYRGDAAELVRLKVDVIVASSQRAVAAKEATSTIPIVMPIITDPVRLGLVASLARPGGNATGFATQNHELPGKWMELAKEAVPNLTRVAALFHPTYDGGVQFKASEKAARSLSLRLQAVNVEASEDFAAAFAEVQRGRPEALIVSSSPLFYSNSARIVEFAASRQLPTIYHQSEFVVVFGGLMSYAPDFRDLFRRSATYVDKILKGVRPGDLPVQQPTKFELVINRRTANALGLTLPQPLLLRADRVIE